MAARKHKFQEEKPGGPLQKKYRAGRYLSSDEVEIYKTHLNNEGLVCSVMFTSRCGCQSPRQVKQYAGEQHELRIGTKMFHLYPAFKEALFRLLTTIEEVLANESNKNRLILVHGVPKVGKTSLAYCLSYFLALMAGSEENVHYLKLSHSAAIDDNVLTTGITDACNDKYLIVDQVNTNSLIISEIMEMARNRLHIGKNPTRMPLIMFTSGHYTPSDKCLAYQNSDLLCYKLIQMHIDDNVVSTLKESMDIDNSILSNNKLLNVTTFYSHMREALEYIANSKSRVDEDDVRNVLYPRIVKDVKNEAMLAFFWLAWNEHFALGLPPLEEFTDNDCKMKTQHAEYFGYLISDVKARDRGIYAILKQMEVVGNTLYAENGYCEFDPTAYCYKYLHKKMLHCVLAGAYDKKAHLSPESRFEVVLNSFNMLQRTGASMFNYVKGGLFELLIKCKCDKEAVKEHEPVGMSFHGRLNFVSVNESVDVATEEDLCNLPLKYERCRTTQSDFWCVLNVPGKPKFTGFDYAYMLTTPECSAPVIKTLQLFQVTVNPEGKSLEEKLIITDVLSYIQKELEKRKLIKRCDTDNVVVPYFVHPSDESGHFINLPFRNSVRCIAAQVLSCPKSLGVK